MRVRKAIIPAAGLGTRFLPATKAIPKEMLAVVDKPMIQYAVEEATASGIKRIGIVTSSWKTAIEKHFGRSPELENFLKEKRDVESLREVENLKHLANMTYINQPAPRGLGHAVLMGKEFAGGEAFAVLNPDTIYDCPVPCLKQLIDVFEEKTATVVVLGRIDVEGTHKHGVVKAKQISERIFKLLDMVEKPGPERAFSDLAVLGRYVFTSEIFEAIEKTPPAKGGEVQLTDALRILLDSQPVYGLLVEGRHYDAGDKFGFLEAAVNFAFKRPEFRDKLKGLLKV